MNQVNNFMANGNLRRQFATFLSHTKLKGQGHTYRQALQFASTFEQFQFDVLYVLYILFGSKQIPKAKQTIYLCFVFWLRSSF